MTVLSHSHCFCSMALSHRVQISTSTYRDRYFSSGVNRDQKQLKESEYWTYGLQVN